MGSERAEPLRGGACSPRQRQRRLRRPLAPWLLAGLALLSGGCVQREQHSSGLILPLPRQGPGDGLAVVNGPGGRGIHIWLDPDTSQAGLCRPRWTSDPARLVAAPRTPGGDDRAGSAAAGGFRSGGRAPRQEFYDALRRGPVRLALRREMAILCRRRAPASRLVWIEPPRSDAERPPALQPLWEEEHLLSNPRAVRRTEKQLLGEPLTPEDWDDRLPPRPPNGP